MRIDAVTELLPSVFAVNASESVSPTLRCWMISVWVPIAGSTTLMVVSRSDGARTLPTTYAGIARVIKRCLTRLPEQRYRKFRDMGRLGHEFLEATP